MESNKTRTGNYVSSNVVREEGQLAHFTHVLTYGNIISDLSVGEYFTYQVVSSGIAYFRKGLKVSNDHMIPIGLPCATLERARLQY